MKYIVKISGDQYKFNNGRDAMYFAETAWAASDGTTFIRIYFEPDDEQYVREEEV